MHMSIITEHETAQVERANASNLNPWSEAKVDSLAIDAGWREVAEKALEFVKRFTQHGKRKVA
jgi:hypothetical protein